MVLITTLLTANETTVSRSNGTVTVTGLSDDVTAAETVTGKLDDDNGVDYRWLLVLLDWIMLLSLVSQQLLVL